MLTLLLHIKNLITQIVCSHLVETGRMLKNLIFKGFLTRIFFSTIYQYNTQQKIHVIMNYKHYILNSFQGLIQIWASEIHNKNTQIHLCLTQIVFLIFRINLVIISYLIFYLPPTEDLCSTMSDKSLQFKHNNACIVHTNWNNQTLFSKVKSRGNYSMEIPKSLK